MSAEVDMSQKVVAMIEHVIYISNLYACVCSDHAVNFLQMVMLLSLLLEVQIVLIGQIPPSKSMLEPEEGGEAQTHDSNDEEVPAEGLVLAAECVVVAHDQGLESSEAGDLPVGLNFKR